MSAPLPEATIERLVHYYQAGWTYGQITAELGVSRNAIKRWAARKGIARRQASKPYHDPVWLAQVAADWGNPQLTAGQIAKAHRMSTATLHKLVKEQDWPARGKGYRTVENSLRPAQLDQIRTLFAASISMQEIARRAGVSICTVRSVGQRLGLTRQSLLGTGQPPEDRIAEFREAWKAGVLQTQLAKRFGVNTATVARWRQVLGLPDRPDPKRREFSDVELQAMQEAYEAGASLNSLCERFHTHKKRIHQEMEARGVERRVVRRPARHKLSDETIEAILVAYWEAGEGVEVICRTHGINTARFYQLLDLHCGGQRRSGPSGGLAMALGKDMHDRIRDLYERGVPVEDIAGQIPGGGEWTVYRALALQGIAPREQAKRGRLQDQQLHGELRQLYADDSLTTAEIEAMLGIHKTTRLKLMKKLGITPRKTGWRR